jgi:hypothetical protein
MHDNHQRPSPNMKYTTARKQNSSRIFQKLTFYEYELKFLARFPNEIINTNE